MAYSLHELPELYFQRVKREEYAGRALRSVAGLVLVAVPYFLKYVGVKCEVCLVFR